MVQAVSQPRNLSAKQSRSLKGTEPFCCTVLASSRTKRLQLIHTILICQFVTEGGKIDNNVVKRHPLSPLLFCSLAHPISLSHTLTQVKKKKKSTKKSWTGIHKQPCLCKNYGYQFLIILAGGGPPIRGGRMPMGIIMGGPIGGPIPGLIPGDNK